MFGMAKRRVDTGPQYDARMFLTTDARQFAFDDYLVITTSQGGLNGLRPLWTMAAAEFPTGFDYMTNLIGLGGTPAPSSLPQPLIAQPRFAASFLADQHYTWSGF